MIDKHKRQHDNTGAKPIHHARILRIDNHLPDQRQRDRQAEPDSHEQRRRKEHAVGPAIVGHERAHRVDEDDRHYFARRRDLKRFDAGDVQQEKGGPEQEYVEEADEAEEEGHVDPALVGAHPFLHVDGVEAVCEGAEESEGVADGDFSAGLEGKGSTAFVVLVGAGHVDGRDDGDPG